jgi:protein O-GlcNAc transferase
MTLVENLQSAVDHHSAGRLPEAEAFYRKVLAESPDHPGALQLLGRLAYEVGKPDIALQLLDRAIQVDPRSAIAFNFRGTALASLGRFRHAANDFQQAIRLNPKAAEVYNNLGNVMRELSQIDLAIAAYQQALALKPDYAMSHSNLAISFKDQGRVAEALASFDRALQFNPADAICDSNRLYTLQFLPNLTPQQLFDEHRQWSRRHAIAQPPIADHPSDRSPDRPLRIGYLSSDFRYHSVAFFLLPLLKSHDCRQFHITAYPTTAYNDDITGQFRAACDQWHPLLGLSDPQAIRQIADDRIDILVDCIGHTSGGRLPLLMRKPAPILVSYLGYPNTTGLQTIDYRLTDARSDPPGAEAYYTEKLFRLPRTAWCYSPLSGEPPIEHSPRNHVVFGSFNDMAKINPPLMSQWIAILNAVPNSRLLIKNRGTNSPAICDRFRARFAELGLQPDRLDLLPPVSSPQDHLRTYAQIDIALDTSSYNGTTTTCESLWMGVPVITQAGQSHVSRVGVSLLTSAGLPDLIATDAAEYHRIAVTLAADANRRRDLRATLRDRLRTSPLMNAPAFARDVEAAYRKMWRTYVLPV